MTEYVGSQKLQVEAGPSLSNFEDKVLLGLMDYLGFWIKHSLDAKLRVQSPTSPDALPTANRFPWDPASYFVQNRFPALYCWSQGPGTMTQFTTLKWSRRREISLTYLFDELVGAGGLTARHGLIPFAEAAVMYGMQQGMHPDYSFDGDALGTPIWDTLGLNECRLISTEEGHMAPVPDIDARSNQGSGHVVRFYPALMIKLYVVETLEDIPDITSATPLADGNLDVYLSYSTASDGSSVTGGSAYFVDLNIKSVSLPSYSAIHS